MTMTFDKVLTSPSYETTQLKLAIYKGVYVIQYLPAKRSQGKLTLRNAKQIVKDRYEFTKKAGIKLPMIIDLSLYDSAESAALLYWMKKEVRDDVAIAVIKVRGMTTFYIAVTWYNKFKALSKNAVDVRFVKDKDFDLTEEVKWCHENYMNYLQDNELLENEAAKDWIKEYGEVLS